jgi:ABC-2 type transport system ATP-binding protein
MFKQGVTVLFVSHSIDQVKSICNKAILLEKGTLLAEGDAEDICDLYESKIK